MPIVTCPSPCNQKNRLIATTKPQRCGKCGRVFTDNEILIATLGERAGVRAPMSVDLEDDEDMGDDDDGLDPDDDENDFDDI